MKKILVSIFILQSLAGICQTESGPITVWQQCINLYRQGLLDSTLATVTYFKTKSQRIDTSQQFFIKLDTFIYKDGYYAIGCSILDPFEDYNGLQIGQWHCFYPSGKLYAVGEFSLGMFSDCMGGSPAYYGYNFKSGPWTYWYENGTIAAKGIYQQNEKAIRNNEGVKTILVSYVAKDWNYFSEDGAVACDPEAFIEKLNNDSITLCNYWKICRKNLYDCLLD